MDISNLKTFLNGKAPLSDAEFAQIMPLVYLKNFKKNDILLRQGEICTFVGFLNQGLIRSYYYDDNGKEITTKFFFENCLFTYVEGFVENTPSNKFFVALEDCTALMMKKKHLFQVFEQSPKFEKIFSLVLMEDLKSIMLDNEAKRNETPQTRYLAFQSQFSQISNRIPLKYIASYLGIEPQSLSRIRRRMSKK